VRHEHRMGLSVSTARVLPTDAVLPQLALVLDERAMQRVFEQQLQSERGHEVKVAQCDIERVKYRPRRNCIIGYNLKLRDAAGEREQRLCAGIYAPDDATARYQQAVAEANIATPYLPPVTLIAPLNMLVWAFPNERKLTALPLLADLQLREKLLPEVVRERWGEGWEIVGSSQTIFSYFPEHSCCISASLTLRHAASGARRSWEILGKTRSDDEGAQTHHHMAALWRGVHADVSYARPLAYQSEHRLLWQERVPGVTLQSLFASGLADNALLIRVARAVAALHGTPVTSPRRVMLSDLIDRLIAAREVVGAARPRCAAALQKTVTALIDSAGLLDVRRDATWHGDLHSNNILVSPTRIYLVDLDAVSIGPPLADLGSFLAELIYRGCLRGEPLETLWPALTAVVTAYRQYASWPAPDADVAWYTASALIHERALRCVTSLKPGRMEALDNLVAAATRIAGGGLFAHCVGLADAATGKSARAA
jgi:aminoglycoside phosphotransferase (APT) family kinase protein